MKWFHKPVSRLRARRRLIRKAEQPLWVVSIYERPATPHPGVRRGIWNHFYNLKW